MKKGQVTTHKPNVPVTITIEGGNVTMRVLSDEQIEKLATGAVGLNLALFTFVCGIAITLLITLYTVKFEDTNVRNLFWAALCAMSILTVNYAFKARADYAKNRRLKKDILTTPSPLPSTTHAITVNDRHQ